MYLLGTFLSALILGGICSYVAKQQDRHPVIWFIAGFFFGVIGLLVLFLLPRKENLNLPTVAASSTIQTQVSAQPKESPTPISSSSASAPIKLWYFLDNVDKQYGPMSFDALKEAWSEQKLNRKTYVWNEDMAEWKPVEELPDLLSKLSPSE